MRRPVVALALILAAGSLQCRDKVMFPPSGLVATDGAVFDSSPFDDSPTDNGPGARGGLGQGQGGAGGFMPGGGGRGTGNPGGGGGRGGDGSNCINPMPVKAATQPAKNRLVFLVAKNASMGSPFGSTTRLGAVQQAVQSQINSYRAAVFFGYQDYPGLACSAGGGDGCCADPGIGTSPNVAQIQNALMCTPSQTKGCVASADGRPVADALNAAIPLFGSAAAGIPYLVIIADGDPGCGSQGGNSACLSAQTNANTLTRDHLVTIDVIVVGQDAQKLSCLPDLASDPPAPETQRVMSATDVLQLSGAITNIVREAARPYCVISLKSGTEVDSNLRVALQDKTNNPGIPPDELLPGTDWGPVVGTAIDFPKIELKGKACEKYQANPALEVEVDGCVRQR